MPTRSFIFGLFIVSTILSEMLNAQIALPSGVIVPRLAALHGMERAWATRIVIDPARHRLAGMSIHDNLLMVLTDAGLLQAIDGETGITQWKERIGRPYDPATMPAVDNEHIAIISGVNLSLLNRETGRPIWERKLSGAPLYRPALTDIAVLVSVSRGGIESYPIGNPIESPDGYASFGKPTTPPLATPDYVCWASDRSSLFVEPLGENGTAVELKIFAPVEAEFAYHPGYAFAASVAGYIYCLDLSLGEIRWRSATGAAVRKQPVVVNGRVYVVNDLRELHCLDLATGDEQWQIEGVQGFLADAGERLYIRDEVGRVAVVDPGTGETLDAIDVGPLTESLANSWTDRLYLATPDGVVVCMREIGRTTPLQHHATDQAPDVPAESTEDAPVEPSTVVPGEDI